MVLGRVWTFAIALSVVAPLFRAMAWKPRMDLPYELFDQEAGLIQYAGAQLTSIMRMIMRRMMMIMAMTMTTTMIMMLVMMMVVVMRKSIILQ